MQTLYLIRHGETEFNREGRVQGHTESSLSPLGQEQARRLGMRIGGLGLGAVYTSPARRAVDTCRIALDGSIAWETREGLREINLGVWEGKKAAEIRRLYPEDVKVWFQKPSALRIEGAETMRRFRGRVARTIDGIRDAHPDSTIAVFAHGGVICVYLTHLLGMKLDNIWRFKIRNGSITRVTFPGQRPRIDLLGDDHHLGDAIRELPPKAFRIFS
jgi:broad specificity phosphatase PhoE